MTVEIIRLVVNEIELSLRQRLSAQLTAKTARMPVLVQSEQAIVDKSFVAP
jgi:hypothetical protein